MRAKSLKIAVDLLLAVGLLLLMSYQVTGEAVHEWSGIAMTALMLVHQILNRRWYAALLKGKYTPLRTVQTLVNAALLICFVLTALCGINMSAHAVPFLGGFMRSSLGRRLHLTLSHWCLVLMGLHLGLHLPAMLRGVKGRAVRRIGWGASVLAAGAGLWLLLKNNHPDYLFYRAAFAFLDYDKPAPLVLLETLLIAFFWAFVGCQLPGLLNRRTEGRKKLVALLGILLAVAIGAGLYLIPDRLSGKTDEAAAPWGAANETEAAPTPDPTPTPDPAPTELDDGFVRIEGGSFLMGSPDDENWRIDDETRHEVTLHAFYIDPRETTQADWQALMGEDPAEFPGERRPVENVSWLDAISYANAKSLAAGLTPAYTVDGETVTWDRAADGYRLPTEAEWEYACRAGTATPFNLERSLDADDANFYGHYPYEIEENYFDDSVLEAKPGRYRGETVETGSFAPNAWGLFDMHGNVNEWCWDWYGPYDAAAAEDPVGAADGTRHVYRGGGWNDFGKNLRSAYRAAGQADLRSYNLGVRLVRNAGAGLAGSVAAATGAPETQSGGRTLIAYFSWSGNTRGVANEIQRQTGFDLFEIEPIPAYSGDYNTVLMEAQRDQHAQARPRIADHVENMADYDTILLGYPNWWASIPMPIASFLEEYDFAGKRIVPFCSHGGGRLGQSLTAIAKLAPEADLGTGLSIHYSGGATLAADVSQWLDANGIPRQ